MSYVSLTQLAAEAKLGGTFSDSAPVTSPNATKAQEIIDENEAMINARISRKYLLPLTQTAPIAMVRGISLALCVERVREIMAVKTGASNAEQVAAKTTADYARKNLERIVAGDLPLIGETLATSGDGVKSYMSANGLNPVFDRTREQW